MGKIRHIALIVPDPEASAKFFEEALELKVVGRARRGIYLSDGTVNVALLKIDPEEGEPRLYHFGVWVDDLEEAEKKAQSGGRHVSRRAADVAELVLRVQIQGPERYRLRPHA